MKKLSLLSLLGLTGLLAFFATPIYAQDNEIVLDDENVVVDYTLADTEAVVEDVVDELEFDDVEEFDDAYVEEDMSELELMDEDLGEVTAELSDGIESLVNDPNSAALLATVLSFLGAAVWVICAICFVWFIFLIIAGWKIFKKAGEAGWKVLIPVYNLYIMYKIAGMKNWFWYTIIVAFVLGLVAGCIGEESNVATILKDVATVFSGIVGIVASFKLPRKFGWGVFASILYVLFSGICALILGFGKSEYEGKSETVVEA